jgi:hypothetical protein
MADRPIFIPILSNSIGVEERILEFKWYPGMAIVQKQKSIRELHNSARLFGISPILEISSKSEDELGIKLSAFNLCITTKLKNDVFTVETAFQSSKFFEQGGPYKDLLGMDSRAAKKDIRLKESGNLIGFNFYGQNFPLTPRTYFYDWLYINALKQNQDLAEQLLKYKGFSDIEFNPMKSINCQAYSAALYLSLYYNRCLSEALTSPERFLELTAAGYAAQRRNMVVQSSIV